MTPDDVIMTSQFHQVQISMKRKKEKVKINRDDFLISSCCHGYIGHNKRPRTVVQDSHEDEFLPSNASLTKDSTSNKESTVSASPTIKPPKRGKEKLKKK